MYKRDSSGQLWQKFSTKKKSKCRRIHTPSEIVRNTSYILQAQDLQKEVPGTPDKGTKECNSNFCNYWGPREFLGISRMTFIRKCEKTCSQFICQECGKQPEEASHQSLDSGVCGDCRDNQEQDGIAKRMASERKVSPNRDLQQRIEDEVLQAFGEQTLHQISRLWEERYGDDTPPWQETHFSFTNEPMFVSQEVQRYQQDCGACLECPAQFQTPDGRFSACLECAETWRKATGQIEWYSIIDLFRPEQSKNWYAHRS